MTLLYITVFVFQSTKTAADDDKNSKFELLSGQRISSLNSMTILDNKYYDDSIGA